MMNLKSMLLAIALTGCCSESTPGDCTQSQLAEKKMQEAVERAKQEADATPQLVTEKDGVRVYRIWTREPYARDHWTYFTTPCGDTRYVVDHSCGKSCTNQIPASVNGTGCQP